MGLYRYKSIDTAGEVVEGNMDGASEQAVADHLQTMGYLPLHIAAAKSLRLKDVLSFELTKRKSGLSSREVLVFTEEMATLLDSGMDLERALSILQSLTKGKTANNALSTLLEDVRGGRSLADALAEHPESFSEFYVSMIRAGEAGGALDTIFGRMAELLEHAEATKGEIRSTLIYPVILLVTSMLSVVALVGFVLPRFKPLFESAGQELPLATQIVMTVGDGLGAYWWLVLLAFICISLLVRVTRATPTGAQHWDSGILQVPIIGDLIAKAETARLTRTLGTLLGNGVPMLQALDITKDTAANRQFQASIAATAIGVKQGKQLSEMLDRHNTIPTMAKHLIHVGEEAGNVETMLLKAAKVYDVEVRQSVKRGLALMTPALTVVLGLLIAGIIFSILTAILTVNEFAF